MSQQAILINLNRCTGCWTCSMACKIGNQLADDEWWQFVRSMGNGSGIDRPLGHWPDLHLGWLPIHTTECTMCGGRVEQGLEPFCVYNCSNLAMTFGDLDAKDSKISKEIMELRDKGYRIFQLPVWERARPEIYYAEK